MKKKKVEPFLVLGPVLLGPVLPDVYPSTSWRMRPEVKEIVKCIAGLPLPEYSLVDVCFIRKEDVLHFCEAEDMSMLDMCMYVINHCRDEGGTLCPYQLWTQFASAYMDARIRMPEYVSLIAPDLPVPTNAFRGIGVAYTHYNLAWRRCSCGEIKPLLPNFGRMASTLAYVCVRKELPSGLPRLLEE